MKHKDDLIEGIAREFSKGLLKELGQELVEQIVNDNELLNLKVTRSEEKFCSSHDHCDANMVMLRAFRTVMNRVPLFLMSENDVDQSLRDEEMELFNSAWTTASKNRFWLPVKYKIQKPARHFASIWTAEERAILNEAELYSNGFISEQGFMLLEDIREKAIGQDLKKIRTFQRLADDHGMSDKRAAILVKWAFAILAER